MPTTEAQRTLEDARQLIASIRFRLRRVQSVVLPRAAAALERSDQCLSDSIGLTLSLASTQRLLDSDS